MIKTSQKINELLEKLDEYQIDGYLIPSNDEFQSEYVPEHLNRLKYITGFTGSSGIAIISKTGNYFFTDGRYFVQAKLELGNSFYINDIKDLLSFSFDGKIGYDPKLFNVNFFKRFNKFNLISCDNLVDLIWMDKPPFKESYIFEYPVKYSGKKVKEKCKELKDYLSKNKLDALIITDSTNICWLLNIRSNDVAYNPILLSYMIFYKNGEFEIFSNSKSTLPLEEFAQKVDKLKGKKVQIDPNYASIWLKNQLTNPILFEDPCLLKKSCKNLIEIKRAKEVHVIDGVAVTKLLYWLDTDKGLKTELSIVNKILEYRKENSKFIYPSFATIAGFKENGAIIHYHPVTQTNKSLKEDGLLLLDSGGQYWGGTTDITRVISVGKPTNEQKTNYTLVLKAHIALASAVFPEDAIGVELDVLARRHLWQSAKDYNHSTGHGVGNALSVHEYPRIGRNSNAKLIPGMIVSNEPGYYKENEYGIRIENLMLVKPNKFGFLSFEVLTLAPFERRLVILSMLSKEEKKWLNNYNQQVYKKLSPYLNYHQKLWLKRRVRY